MHPIGIWEEIKPDKLVIFCKDFFHEFPVPVFPLQFFRLIIKNIREPFQENERQNIILVFRGIDLPTDFAGCLP